MDLDNIQRKYGLPAPLPVVQNGKFATRFPLNLEHRGDDVFQFGGKYIGEIENIYDLLYKILTNQEIDVSLALPYAIKITEDKLYIRDKTNSEWITIFDITKPNFPKEIELYELIYKAITHQVIGEDTSYPGQFKIEENILYVRDKDNLTWTQIGDVTKEFLGATEATQAILDEINEILTEVQELKTELNRQIATANETLTTALQAANEAMTSAQSINIRTFNSVEEMKASNTLKAGALAKTLGFYTAGDGGGADYVVKDTTDNYKLDEASIITLKNNLFAHLIIQDVLNVKQMGAYGDGVHDDTNVLKDKIFLTSNPYIRGITAYFPDGDYLISETLETSTEYPRSIRMEKSARIFTETDDLEYLIRLGRWGTAKWNGSIIGGILDANDKAKCCFGASSYNYFSYQDVSCRNFKLYGVHTNPNNIPSYWFRGNNMYFKNTTEWTGSTSIRCGNVDNFFTDIFSEGVHKGIYLRDKTMVTNMHHWLLPDSGIVTDSCLAEIDNTDNASLGFGTVFTRCYADTTQYAIRVINTQNTDSSHVDVWTRDCFFQLADTDSGAIYVLNNGARVTDIGSYFFTSKNANAKVVKADTPDYNNYTFVATTIAGNNNDNAFFDNWHRLKSQGIDNANTAIYEGTYFMLPSAQNAPKNVNTMLEVVRSPQSWNNNQAYILQKAYTLETDQTIALYVRYGLGFNNSITFKKWTRIASWQADA